MGHSFICELDDVHFSSAWPDGLIEIDANNVIVNVNAQSTIFLGWEKNELIGRIAYETVTESSVQRVEGSSPCPIVTFSSDALMVQEGYWIHKDQQVIAISYKTVPTTRNTKLLIFQTCESLGYQIEELRKLSTFTEINPAPLLEVDSQGLILFSNPAMTELMLTFGFNDEGMANILPEKLSEFANHCLSTNSEIEGIESDAIDEDEPENHRFFIWRFHPIHDAQRESVLICGVDISHKKQMERQQAEFQQTLELEKAKARKEYLAKMVHELRSPLNAVVGYATLLKQKLASVAGEKYLPLFDRIIEGGNQLAEQISATLESSRVESGKIQAEIAEFEVNSIIHELAEKLSIMADKKNLKMSADIPIHPLRIKADSQHVRQVVINLLSNAIKYTAEGEIKLIVSEIEDSQIGSAIAISVQDTGSGISDSEKESVFQLFKRQAGHVKGDIEGDGFGLAICVEMMSLNFGRVSLESELGIGSTFTAIFPRAAN